MVVKPPRSSPQKSREKDSSPQNFGVKAKGHKISKKFHTEGWVKNMWFNVAIWLLAGCSLAYSWAKDNEKTRRALMKGWKAFESILPDFAGVLLLVGLTLAILSPKTITSLIGGQTGFWGMLLTSGVGAVTLIPGFIAFPLARSLLDLGAGIRQIAVFISTLMMVGIVTAPMEARYFGRKATVLRNVLAYAFSFLTAFVVGVVAGR